MYKLPPLYKPIEVTPIPDCVYKMKRISDHFNGGNASENYAAVTQIEDVIDLLCLLKHILIFFLLG